jgi:hypothetical protein
MGTLSSPPCCPEDLPADVITRRVVDEDLPSVLAIYEEGLATRNATFETRLPTATQIRGRWMPGMAWVAELHGDVVRWTAVMPVSGRDCYAGGGGDLGVRRRGRARARGGQGIVVHAGHRGRQGGGVDAADLDLPGEPRQPGPAPLSRLPHPGRADCIAQLDGVSRDTVLLEHRSEIN